MSAIMEYVKRTFDGMDQFFSVDKTVGLLLAVLILFWLQKKYPINEKGNRLLTFSLLTSVFLLCPFTAVVGVMYQTAFYDYEWLWSMVPITIVLSYAVVLLYDTKVKKSDRKQKIISILVFVILLFWSGNQGMIKTVPSMEAEQRQKAGAVAELLKEEAKDTELLLWAPIGIMQETRRQTGEVSLVYGRDMWEAKAGAYDYEVYSEFVISAYEWMLDSEEIAGNGETILKAVRVLWELEEMNARLQDILPVLLEDGVNTIVIPIETVELFEVAFFPIVEEKRLSVEEIQIESYMLYRLKQ